MKKLMIVIGLCSVVLFGADVKVAQPAMAVQMSPADLEEQFKGATKLEFVETKPTQFTIKVPIDVDYPFEAGIPTLSDSTIKTTGKLMLACTIRDDSDSIVYTRSEVIPNANDIMIMKFNGIPNNKARKITEAYCGIGVELTNGDYRYPDILDDEFENINHYWKASFQ